MTTLNEAREAIYDLFVTAWGATTPVTADNEAYDSKGVTEFVRIAVRHRASTQETLGATGGRKFARTGAVFVQIFAPLDAGVQRSDVLTATARAVFEGVTIAGTTLWFRDVIVTEQGPQDKWYRTTVEAVFTYTETK